MLLGDQVESFLHALEEPPPVSLRFNPAKQDGGSCRSLISAQVPWSSYGFFLKERPSFTFDPLFHAGQYYVQEASSMFVEQAVRTVLSQMGSSSVPLRMLDLCAAPGGKSTLLLSLLPENGYLVANEVIRSRAAILVENIRKWGSPNVVVTNNEPSDFAHLEDFFDLILVDAPCSGEGMFRKDPDSVNEWSPEHVRHCSVRQQSILEDSLSCLKPGGFLIYSTCTYNTEEDERVVRWLMDRWHFEPKGIAIKKEWGVLGSMIENTPPLPIYRFMPHLTTGEGFFLCLLQKPETDDFSPKQADREGRLLKRKKKVPELVDMPFPNHIRDYIVAQEDYLWETNVNGQINAIPLCLRDDFASLLRQLRVLHAGIVVGEMKGKSFLPHPSLALSTALNRASVQTCSLDLKQAIAYLRGEALVLSPDCPLGWVLAVFEGYALGWMKNIGQRANNGWPAEWRIRSANPF